MHVIRAIWVLERIGTHDAKVILEGVGRGAGQKLRDSGGQGCRGTHPQTGVARGGTFSQDLNKEVNGADSSPGELPVARVDD